MTTEEKAKAYDKALEWMRKVYPTLMETGKKDVEYYFPEVKESEDERIIRAIIDALYSHTNSINLLSSRNYQMEDIEAWLEKQKINTEGDFGRGYDCGYKACLNSHGAEFFEKQKEQKSVKWSEKDSSMLRDIVGYITGIGSSSGITKQERVDFLYGLPKRFNFQSEQEWSEEDKFKLEDAITGIDAGIGFYETEGKHPNLLKAIIEGKEWLKSLPERFNLEPKEQTTLKYLLKRKINNIMFKLTSLSFSKLIPINSEEYRKINEITSDVCELLDYPIEKKQGEQKLIGWSEEDEEMFDEALTGILLAKNRMNDTGCIGLAERFEKAYKWLESFRSRPHWKPSEEQMRALWEMYQGGKAQAPIASLYEDLKKL